MSRTNYVAYETGRIDPSAVTLAAIASILNVHPRALTTTVGDDVTLRDLREYAGHTHQSIAEALGYAAARSYRDVELGHRALTDDLAGRLASILDVDADIVWAAWDRSPGTSR